MASRSIKVGKDGLTQASNTVTKLAQAPGDMPPAPRSTLPECREAGSRFVRLGAPPFYEHGI